MRKIYILFIFLFLSKATISQVDIKIGFDSGHNESYSYPAPLQDWYEGSRSQYLYLASELQAQGMSAGFINSLKFNVISLNGFYGYIEQLSISIGNTQKTSLDLATWEPGTNQIIAPIFYQPILGINQFNFITPFYWNGVDNIIVEICNGDPYSSSTATYSSNVSCPLTTGLPFNASHTYIKDNVNNLCGTSYVVNTGSPDTRPDIIFSWANPTPCNGSPIGGVTASNKDSICSNKPFNLFVAGSNFGSNIIFQWQDSVPGTSSSFSDISGANSYLLDIPNGISVSKYFRRKITCSGNTKTSTPKLIYVKSAVACYCKPANNTTLHTVVGPTIESVGIYLPVTPVNYINNHSGANPYPSLGYADFTDTTSVGSYTIVKQAEYFTLVVGTSYYPPTKYVGYWIDWNHSGTFDSSEYVNIPFQSGNTSSSIVVNIPDNATLGYTILRIRISAASFNYADACTTFSSGETEDYVFKVIKGTNCNGTPLGGIAISSDSTICPSTPFSLSVSNATEGVIGLQYQWQSYTPQNGWQDIINGTGKTLSISGISEATHYRRKITCGISTNYSTNVYVKTRPFLYCYCGPTTGVTLHTNTGPNIESITLNGGNALSGITNFVISQPGLSPSGFFVIYDTTIAPNLSKTLPYVLTLATSATPTKAAAWIDWDHNGIFDTSEMSNITFPPGSTIGSIVITPSANCLIGLTMIRVRIRSANFTGSCETFGSGGTFDFIINIKELPVCNIVPLANSINLSGCDSLIYKGKTYKTSTLISDTARSKIGCDSIYITTNINVYHSISGNVKYPIKSAIKNVDFKFKGNVTDSIRMSNSYLFDCSKQITNGTIKPTKNNDITKANGVTSIDALLTQRHILNIAKLNSPYKIIAADVNGDKAINSIDILRIKRLILGTDTTFTKTVGTTKIDRLWEFVDSAYVFPDTTNPFPFKDSISFTNLTSNKINQTFIGVKLGDVNYDWNPAVAKGASIDNVELIIDKSQWTIDNGQLKIPIKVKNFKEIAAMQYTFHFDNTKYEFVNLEGFKNIEGFEYNTTQANTTGNIAMLWTDKNAEAKTLEDGTELFVLVLRSTVDRQQSTDLALTIDNSITDIEAWDKDFIQHNIVLVPRTINDKPQTINEIVIYPNPANNIVNIDCKNASRIVIVDATGRKVYDKNTINNQSSIIDVKQFVKGIYIVQASLKDGNIINEKLIVE